MFFFLCIVYVVSSLLCCLLALSAALMPFLSFYFSPYSLFCAHAYVVAQSQWRDSIESSVNSTFEFYLSNEPIQESWNNAQKTVSI